MNKKERDGKSLSLSLFGTRGESEIRFYDQIPVH